MEIHSCFPLFEKWKETVLDFSQGAVKVLQVYFSLIENKMSKHNILTVELSNSQLNKLESAIKTGTEVNLNLSSKLSENSNDETHFSYNLLLTDSKILSIRKTFPNGSSANVKFLKTQVSKMQLRRLLDLLLEPTLASMFEAGKMAVKKGVAKSAGEATKYYLNKGINKLNKRFTGITLTNYEMKDIIKVVRSLENRGILLKETTKNIATQDGGFLMFLKPLMAAGLRLMKSVLAPLAKSVLLPLGLTATPSAANEAIQK